MFSFRLLNVLFLLLYVSYRGKIKKRLIKKHCQKKSCQGTLQCRCLGDGLETLNYIDMTSYDGFRLLNSEIGNDHMRGCNRIYQQHICNFIIIRGVFSLFPPIIPKMV